MAPQWKPYDMNVVAPDENEKSTGSSQNSSVNSDHYQYIY